VDEVAVRLAVAGAIGLLIGAERERRMAEQQRREAAGVRTFALVSLLGGLAEQVGSEAVLALVLGFAAAAAIMAYWREETQSGLTSEVALLVALLLGVFAQRSPAVASGIAVLVTVLLAARTALHDLVSRTLTDSEVHDALILLAAALVVLPLAPNRPVDPLQAINPFEVWRMVVLMLVLSAVGYIAVRWVGPGRGLPVVGFLGGFVSSTATIAAMATRQREESEVRSAAVAGAALSSVATVVLLAAVLGVSSFALLRAFAVPLAAAGAGSLAAAGLLTMLAARSQDELESRPSYGRAFDLRIALILGATIAIVTFTSAAASEVAGNAGVAIVAGLTGLADVHSTAFSIAALVAHGNLEPGAAVLPLAIAFTTNVASKILAGYLAGGVRFILPVAFGLAVSLGTLWVAVLLNPLA
jgi:uncharacterized membrane protein (DUF4010 family)